MQTLSNSEQSISGYVKLISIVLIKNVSLLFSRISYRRSERELKLTNAFFAIRSVTSILFIRIGFRLMRFRILCILSNSRKNAFFKLAPRRASSDRVQFILNRRVLPRRLITRSVKQVQFT